VLRYARIHLFYRLLAPYQVYARTLRSKLFVERMGLRPEMRVVDFGGTPALWELVETPLDITMINLEYETKFDPIKYKSHHKLTFAIGDVCNLEHDSNSFDLAFSNSVIEHVGDDQRQQAFADNIRRLAPRYWVQTPAKWFPIEAHTGMPFWWFYPDRLRAKLIASWRDKLPAWTEMVEGTRLVERSQLTSLFPDGRLLTERSLGITKSYIAYRSVKYSIYMTYMPFPLVQAVACLA
jgi:hypothetical protein